MIKKTEKIEKERPRDKGKNKGIGPTGRALWAIPISIPRWGWDGNVKYEDHMGKSSRFLNNIPSHPNVCIGPPNGGPGKCEIKVGWGGD